MADLTAAVEAALTKAVGRDVRVRSRVALGGGDISHVQRLDTDAGTFVLKSHPHPPTGLFQAEARGLAALASSGTSLRVPLVIACSDTPPFLLLEDLGRGNRTRDFDDAFGRGLAELHHHSSADYGFDTDNFCGATPQPNPHRPGWVAFYAEARLGYQIAIASRAGLLRTTDRDRLDQLVSRLDTWIDEPEEGPALIHGDLWSGNLHVAADGMPALIDPAASFSHREAELGMMTLFGGFASRMFAAYEEAFPLDAGWRERNPLYQLYHLLNHLNLFGHGYHGQVMTVVSRYV